MTRKFMSMLVGLELMTRNSVCYCGSDKRFKHCHGALDSGNPA